VTALDLLYARRRRASLAQSQYLEQHAFHGTSKANLRAIRAVGLLPKNGQNTTDDEGCDDEAKVCLALDRSTSKEYAGKDGVVLKVDLDHPAVANAIPQKDQFTKRSLTVNGRIPPEAIKVVKESDDRYQDWGYITPTGKVVRGASDWRHEDVAEKLANDAGLHSDYFSEREDVLLAHGYTRYWVDHRGNAGYEGKRTAIPHVIKHLQDSKHITGSVRYDLLSVHPTDPEVFSVIHHGHQENYQEATRDLQRLHTKLNIAKEAVSLPLRRLQLMEATGPDPLADQSRDWRPIPEQLAQEYGFQEHNRQDHGALGTVTRYQHPSGDQLILTRRRDLSHPVGQVGWQELLQGGAGNWDTRWEYHTIDGVKSTGYDVFGLRDHLTRVHGR
jgi:hypothetical protein